jgi:hypothetical protein
MAIVEHSVSISNIWSIRIKCSTKYHGKFERYQNALNIIINKIK